MKKRHWSQTPGPSLNKGSAKESSGLSSLPTRAPLPTITLHTPLSWAIFMTAFFMERWQPLHRNAIITESGRFCYVCKVAEKDLMVAGCRRYIYLTPSMRRTALSIFCIILCGMNPLSTVNAKGQSLSSLTNVSKNVETVTSATEWDDAIMLSTSIAKRRYYSLEHFVSPILIGSECILCNGTCWIPHR